MFQRKSNVNFLRHIYWTMFILFLIISSIAPAVPGFCQEPVYQEAMRPLATEQSESAYDILWEKIMAEPDNIRINFLLGKAATKLKLYENAAAAYERILVADPDNVKAQFHLAIAYYRLGAYFLAEKEFNNLMDGGVSARMKATSEKFLTAIQKHRNSHGWKISLAAGRLYNSNVTIGQSDNLMNDDRSNDAIIIRGPCHDN